jgi:hypothetical protein
VRWHHHFLDAADLLVDEPTQLSGAVSFGSDDTARKND